MDELVARWPATVYLFATALNYRLLVYFSLLSDPMTVGMDAFLQVWDGLQAYAFLPFVLIRQVINKLVSSSSTFLTHRSVLATKGVVSGAPESHGGSSSAPSYTSRRTQIAPLSLSAPEPPRAESSCVATVQQFARHLRLSRRVATQLSRCRRQSSRRLYQHKWDWYWSWCVSQGHSVATPTISKITDFLLFLRMEKPLFVSTIKGYLFTPVSVFKFCLPKLLDSFLLSNLIRSFEIERPSCPVGPPPWDLVKVLPYLRGSTFEPLASKPLRLATMKVSFLLALATTKRVGELQTLFCRGASRVLDISLSYLPEFVAKIESERNPLPCSFLVKSLEEFVGDLPEERLLCPVLAVRIYLSLNSSVSPRP